MTVMTTRAAVRGTDGATAVEYGLLVALIAIAIVGAVIALGDCRHRPVLPARDWWSCSLEQVAQPYDESLP